MVVVRKLARAIWDVQVIIIIWNTSFLMKSSRPVYGNWDNKVLNWLRENNGEWFSANNVSEHFNITIEDAFMVLNILERGGSVKKKSDENNSLFQYIS